jgi:hypothetical protein
MIFDYVLGRHGSTARAAFTVEADSRAEADKLLVERLMTHGYSSVDLLYWSVVSVGELRRKP